VHRILIVTALVATLFYAGWEARESTRTGETIGFVRSAKIGPSKAMPVT